MSNHVWHGVFPAITTQFNEDQSLDLAGFAKHAEVLIQSGINGLIVNGSLGENQTMDPDEKLQVVAAAVKQANGRIPVLSGVAETSTAAGVRYVRRCAELGAAGFMIMPAMVYKADFAEAIRYFRTVGAATGLPWMLYNNPISYPVDIKPDQLHHLTDMKNLVAMKESSGDPRRITDIRLAIGDRLSMFVGVDDLVLESAIAGIDGWVAGTGIAFPEENQRLWELTRAKKWDEALCLYHWFSPLLKLDVTPKFVQYIKLAVQEAGLGKEWVREPRMPITGEERERVLAIIRKGIANRPKA